MYIVQSGCYEQWSIGQEAHCLCTCILCCATARDGLHVDHSEHDKETAELQARHVAMLLTESPSVTSVDIHGEAQCGRCVIKCVAAAQR